MSKIMPTPNKKDQRKRSPERFPTEDEKPVVLNLTITAAIFKRLANMRRAKGSLNETELIRVGISNMLDVNGF